MVLSAWTKSFYARALFIAIVGCAALAGGMYAGKLLTTEQPVLPIATQKNASDVPRIILGVGDLFPLEPCTDLSGRKENFGDLLANHEAVVLFVSLECGPCHDLINAWQTWSRERLRPGVRLVVALPSSVDRLPSEYAGLFRGLTTVRYDELRWRQTYHLVFAPIVVGVDGSGFITHLQYGYADALDYQLVERFFTSNNSGKEVTK